MEQHVQLYGDAGSVEADFSFGNFGNAGASMVVRAARAPDGLYADLPIPDRILGGLAPADFAEAFNTQPVGDRYFIDCILNDRQPTPSLWDGAIVQEVIEAAITSHREGRWVPVAAVKA
jgi:predicted dehydrogenase